MDPIKFPQSNVTFQKPATMTDEECCALPVCAGKRSDGFPEIVSAWKVSPEELAEINRTGIVWVGIIGAGLQPMWLSGHEPQFPVMPKGASKAIIYPEIKKPGENEDVTKN